MNKRRLLKLADLLEADAKNKKGIKFDLEVIAVRSNDSDVWESRYRPGDVVPVDCGTAACAVGLACISGAFAEEGLSYTITQLGVIPRYEDALGWGEAEQLFFEITEDESEFLFQPYHYPHGKSKGAVGERYVAKRIRDFVAGKVGPGQ